MLQAGQLPTLVVAATRQLSQFWRGRISTELSLEGTAVSVSAQYLGPRNREFPF